jgi:hypothetical protein
LNEFLQDELQIWRISFRSKTTTFVAQSPRRADWTKNGDFSWSTQKTQDPGLGLTVMWQVVEDVEGRLEGILYYHQVSRLPERQEPGNQGFKVD